MHGDAEESDENRRMFSVSQQREQYIFANGSRPYSVVECDSRDQTSNAADQKRLERGSEEKQ